MSTDVVVKPVIRLFQSLIDVVFQFFSIRCALLPEPQYFRFRDA